MSKIDKIIQIVSNIDGEILGISESGRMYKYYAALAGGSLRYNACWELEIESPVVDNSACEDLNEPVDLTHQEKLVKFTDFLQQNWTFEDDRKEFGDDYNAKYSTDYNPPKIT